MRLLRRGPVYSNLDLSLGKEFTLTDGLCLFAKRLERGRFVWPKVDQGTIALTRAQLAMLLEGIDWRRPERTAEPRAMV
ncbi:MAG: hypothetical protein DMG97_39450 [Acidobacteria bacterium]|nr:MAG: hypothetical protein DMG97_39450 [Acidobacteriota bacterium]